MITETREERLIREIKFKIGDGFSVTFEICRNLNGVYLQVIHIDSNSSWENILKTGSIEESLDMCLRNIKKFESEEITFENYFIKHFLNK